MSFEISDQIDEEEGQGETAHHERGGNISKRWSHNFLRRVKINFLVSMIFALLVRIDRSAFFHPFISAKMIWMVFDIWFTTQYLCISWRMDFKTPPILTGDHTAKRERHNEIILYKSLTQTKSMDLDLENQKKKKSYFAQYRVGPTCAVLQVYSISCVTSRRSDYGHSALATM